MILHDLDNNKNDSKMTAEGMVGTPTCFITIYLILLLFAIFALFQTFLLIFLPYKASDERVGGPSFWGGRGVAPS
jgi:hypothetical protein